MKFDGTYDSIYIRENVAIFETQLDTMFKAVTTYQQTWDSDDNDDALKAYYNNIIEREYKLHACPTTP